MPEQYKIKVRTIEGVILVFRNVLSYETEEGLIKFIDAKTGQQKIFSTNSVEISLESDSR